MFDFLWNTYVPLKPLGQHPQWPKNSECLTSKIKYIEKYIIFKILYRNILILIYGQPVFKVFFHSHMHPNKNYGITHFCQQVIILNLTFPVLFYNIVQ